MTYLTLNECRTRNIRNQRALKNIYHHYSKKKDWTFRRKKRQCNAPAEMRPLLASSSHVSVPICSYHPPPFVLVIPYVFVFFIPYVIVFVTPYVFVLFIPYVFVLAIPYVFVFVTPYVFVFIIRPRFSLLSDEYISACFLWKQHDSWYSNKRYTCLLWTCVSSTKIVTFGDPG